MSVRTSSLVQNLFTGPIDVVGDIHGEIDALQNLLTRLGYGADGSHSEGRRLVFVGDLTDRGPDSPAVVRLVKQFVESGPRAVCARQPRSELASVQSRGTAKRLRAPVWKDPQAR